AVPLEAFCGVVAEGEIGRAVDRNSVVVVKPDPLAKLEVSGEGSGFMRDPFHQVAVAANEIRVVIDDGVVGLIEHGGEVCLRYRHTDRVADALAERARRRLDTGGVAVLRMP